MPADLDDDAPAGSHSDARSAINDEAEALGVQKRPHGDVTQWLEHNLRDEERGPLSHDEGEDHGDQVATAQEPRIPTEDNLTQLPIGATFGMDHAPSAQEREGLVRFAAAADAELRGHRESDERGSEEEQAEVEHGEDGNE